MVRTRPNVFLHVQLIQINANLLLPYVQVRSWHWACTQGDLKAAVKKNLILLFKELEATAPKGVLKPDDKMSGSGARLADKIVSGSAPKGLQLW